jgi:hypothetical protein
MDDIKLKYESTSDDDTSCEENKDKVKLIRKSSSKYKDLKKKSEPAPINRLQKLFNERKNVIKPIQQLEQKPEHKLEQKPEHKLEQKPEQKPVIQSIAQPSKNITTSTLMLIKSRR